MNPPPNSPERSALDFIHFALTFLGFMFFGTGVVLQVIAVAVIGGLLMAAGFAYFGFQDNDRG